MASSLLKSKIQENLLMCLCFWRIYIRISPAFELTPLLPISRGLSSISYVQPTRFQKKNRLNLNNNLWDENELKNLLTSHGFYGKICLNKDNILAFCLAKTSGDRLEIYSIFVDIFWRRKGIAKKILEDCINFCKKKKVEKIILEVSSKNKVAKKLTEFTNY